jgi:hypothetical protein
MAESIGSMIKDELHKLTEEDRQRGLDSKILGKVMSSVYAETGQRSYINTIRAEKIEEVRAVVGRVFQEMADK